MVVHLRFEGVERLTFMNDYHSRFARLPDILDEADFSWNEFARQMAIVGASTETDEVE